MDEYVIAWTDKYGNNNWVSRDSVKVADRIKNKLENDKGNTNVGVYFTLNTILHSESD